MPNKTPAPVDPLHVESRPLIKEPKKKFADEDNRLKQRKKLSEVQAKKSSRSH
jgi:hypothetical protein